MDELGKEVNYVGIESQGSLEFLGGPAQNETVIFEFMDG
jgi:hypothetical protein